MPRLRLRTNAAKWGDLEVKVERDGVSTLKASIVNSDNAEDVIDYQRGHYVDNELAAEIQRRWNVEPDSSILEKIPGYKVFGEFILLFVGVTIGLIAFVAVLIYRLVT